MRVLRSARWLLLAFVVFLIPATSHAGVLISVAIAPPALPVYVQPVCPEPGWMWTPGYWAYDYNDGGYYWVPGTWVPAPAVGMLWTPGYWGFDTGVYLWHAGYWGPHVGYYGGVNYGFGYMGIGFAGGMWRGGVFAYNTAVMHVGVGGVWGSRVYVDNNIVVHNTIVNNNHVAYAGGPGGINHPASAEERVAMNDHHVAPTSFQTQHVRAAAQDKSSYFNNNHGRPATVAAARPLTATPAHNGSMNAGAMNNGGRQNGAGNAGERPNAYQGNRSNGTPQSQPRPTPQEARPTSQQSRPAPQQHEKQQKDSHEKDR